MRVPTTANSRIVVMLRKKFLRLSVYPASKMMGGSSRKKNVSGSNCRKSSSAALSFRDDATPPTSMPTSIDAALSGR